MAACKRIEYSKIEIEVTYDIGEGNRVYSETLRPDEHKFRFFDWLGFSNLTPPEFVVLADGDFIRSLYVKRVSIRRFKRCEEGDCPDQFSEYQL